MNKINFVTGQPYTLSEIFSGDRRIIIPDLQRDYCWGNEEHKTDNGVIIELVSGFIDGIIDQSNSKDNSELTPIAPSEPSIIDQSNSKDNRPISQFGLLYGYESPQNHIQLCDGQQRITTLFLLIGMLNKFSGNNKYRQFLISDFEYFNDDREPYLQYSIRESSLYFLSDLVCHYFIKSGDDKEYVEELSDIRNSNWYYSEYDSDSSIQSMLKAIKIIKSKLDASVIDKCILADYVLNSIAFMYYDMENRKNGEETFVVINLAGEPLSDNQNLKPRVIDAKINGDVKNIAERWEEIETWFWRNRDKNKYDTADAGFNEFLRWVMILEDKENVRFSIEQIYFEKIYAYWKSLKFLYEKSELKDVLNGKFLSPDTILSLVDLFKLLPLIAYCAKFGTDVIQYRDCLRVYRYFENIARYEAPSNENKYVVRAIDLVNQMPNKDIVSILGVKVLLPEEEEVKLQILKDSECRERVENALWAMQSDEVPGHRIWDGRIRTIVDWAIENDIFEIGLFERYMNILDGVFSGDCRNNINITRRALLTRNLSNYPIGGTHFCWDWDDWYKLIVTNNNQEKFKLFLDDLLNSDNIVDRQQEMCDNNPIGKDYDEFVKCSYLMEYSNNNKHICKSDNGLFLCKSSKAERFGVMTAHLLHYLGASWENGFKIWKDYLGPWKICYHSGYNGLIVIQNNCSKEQFYLDIACNNGCFDIHIKQRKGQISLGKVPDGFRFENNMYCFSKELSENAKKKLNFSEEKSKIDSVLKFIDEQGH